MLHISVLTSNCNKYRKETKITNIPNGDNELARNVFKFNWAYLKCNVFIALRMNKLPTHCNRHFLINVLCVLLVPSGNTRVMLCINIAKFALDIFWSKFRVCICLTPLGTRVMLCVMFGYLSYGYTYVFGIYETKSTRITDPSIYLCIIRFH